MKTRVLFFWICLTTTLTLSSQDYGKIIILNGSPDYPPIIVSLNGVRLQNTYAQSVTYKYADETIYRVKILQSGYTGLLRFNIGSEARYVSTYLLTKDNTGSFTLLLQSKSLMMGDSDLDPPQTNTVAVVQINTIAPTPTPVPAAFVGPVAMTNEVYKRKCDEVKSKTFDDDKFERIKDAFEYENFTTAQVIGLMNLFSFDDKKIETAMFAYPKTIDDENFYKTYDQLSFPSSKSKLKDWVNNNKAKK
jgi:hypothetical protein